MGDIFGKVAYSRLKYMDKRNDFPTIVLIGDSITNQNGNFEPISGNKFWATIGYFSWVQLRSNGHFDVLRESGVGGNTTAQILARLQADAIDYRPDWCVVEAGINDVDTGVTAETTIANLTAIYTALRANGIKIIITTLTPHVDVTTDAKLLILDTINEFIRQYALDNEDVIFVDWFQCIASTDGKTAQATYTSDGTHPSVIGAWRMGKLMYECMNKVFNFSSNSKLAKTSNQSNNLLLNGALVGDTSGKADNWSTTGSTDRTYTKEYYDDGTISFNEQCVTSTVANTMSFYQDFTTGYSAGDILEALVRIRFESVTAITRINVSLVPSGSTIVSTSTLSGTDLTPALILDDAVYTTPRLVVLEGITSFRLNINIYGFIGKVKFSNPTVRKIT